MEYLDLVNGVITITFSRLLNTNDPYDLVINNAPIDLAWCYHSDPNGAVNGSGGNADYDMHTNQGDTTVNLVTSTVPQASSTSFTSLFGDFAAS